MRILHWIDSETQALLDRLIESLPTAHLLLLVNYRPEYQHGWGSKTFYTQVRLDPLPPASAEAFLAGLLGDDPSLAPLLPLFMARTAGNPFFLEESVRTLVETAALVGTPGAYRLAAPLQDIPVPATVQAVLAARIDRLAPEEKGLLQTAAVLGTDVPFTLLRAIADVPEAALHRSLAHLQAAEFLYETRLFPEPEYTFKHALTHEVAYGSLLLERRRGLHARLVEALEALAPERVAEQVDRLAHHALRGEVWDKAVTYCQQAGVRAYDRAAFREAVASFEQALQALAHLPEDGNTRGLAIELRLALDSPLRQLGEHRAEPRPVGRGRGPGQGARRSGPAGTGAGQDGQVRMIRETSTAPWRQASRPSISRPRSATAPCRCKHPIPGAGILGHRRLRPGGRTAAAERGGGGPGVWHAQYRLADPVPGVAGADLERARGLRRGSAPRGGGAAPRHAGRPRRHHRSSPTVASATCTSPKGTWSTPSGCSTKAWPSVVPPATGLVASDRGGSGLCHCAPGAPRGGARAAGGGDQRRYPHGRAVGQAHRVAWLSEVCRLAGRGEEAWQHARQALDLARQLKARGDEALALHQLGVVQAHADPPDVMQAEAHYQQALALAEELGMRPLQAHCHRGLGMLYATTGQPEQARAALATAVTLYRTMEMTLWLPETETALAQVEHLKWRTS